MTEWREAIEKTLTLIEGNITEEYTLLDLANQAGYSPFHFSRLFRFVCGTTIRKYIADRRLCRAALDIRDTQERILDIASQIRIFITRSVNESAESRVWSYALRSPEKSKPDCVACPNVCFSP